MRSKKFLRAILAITLILSMLSMVACSKSKDNKVETSSIEKSVASDASSETSVTPSNESNAEVTPSDATCTTKSGISIKLPDDYIGNLMWSQMDENATGYTNMGFPNVETALSEMDAIRCELSTYQDGFDRNTGYNIHIDSIDAPEDLSNDSLFTTYSDALAKNMAGEVDLTSATVLGYGTVKINDVTYFKVYFESDGDALYCYLLITNDGIAHEIVFWNIKKIDEAEYFDGLVRDTMRSVSLSDELRAHVVSPTGEAFKMVEGDHPAAVGLEADASESSPQGGGDEIPSGTVYNLNSGISLRLPDDYAASIVWNQMDENATGFKNLGFPNIDVALSEMKAIRCELNTYQDGFDRNTGYNVHVDSIDAPEDLSNDSVFTTYSDALAKNMAGEVDLTSATVLGYGTVKIDDVTYFKVYFESDGDALYCYLLITDDGIAHEIVFWNIKKVDEAEYFDGLVRDTMRSVSLSDELRAHVVSPTGEAFKMVEGDHPAAVSMEDGLVLKSGEAPVTTPAPESTTPAPKKEKTLYQKITGYEFPIYILLISLVVILLLGSKVAGRGEWIEEPLSLAHAKAIQGFSAVAIIIHHLAQQMLNDAGVLSFFKDLGVLFVGIFFFFSGYGLFTSLKSKDNYLKGFLKKRLVTILVPFYTCILIFVTFAFVKGQKFTWVSLLKNISGWILINSHMWYIVEIAVLYLMFFVIYRLIKNRAVATCVMSLCVIGMTVGSLLLGHGNYWFQGEWWFNASLTFVLGILVSQNAEKLRKFARRFYPILLSIFVVLTVVFARLSKYALEKWSYWTESATSHGYKDKFLTLSFQLSWILIFVVMLLLIMMKVKFGNPILKFLGSISLELYLIHNLFLQGLSKAGGSMAKISSNSLYILLTVLLSIAFAAVISGFDKYIISLIHGKVKPSQLPDISSGKSTRVHSLDVMRIVMAFLVVTIHIPFNGQAGSFFITYGKLAVPFFLTVCGYLLYRKDSKEMMARLWKQTKKIFILYVGSNLLYLVATAIDMYRHSHSLNGLKYYFTSAKMKDFLLYNMSPFADHLWFLGSLLYALLILMLLNKLKAVNWAMFAAPLLIGAYVVLSHQNVATPIALRNAILVGISYTMMGMLIRRFESQLKRIKAPILWVLAAVLCGTAYFEMTHWKQGTAVPFISCEILVYIIVLLCLKYPNFGAGTLAEKMGRDLSLPIYILHYLGVVYLPRNDGYMRIYGAFTVFVLSCLVATIYAVIKRRLFQKNRVCKVIES